MTSFLKNLFHRDLSLALFNATNNNRLDYVTDISNLQKDIKIKNLIMLIMELQLLRLIKQSYFLILQNLTANF